MLVVKTTSPPTSPFPAKLQPSNAAPSSRTSVVLLRTYSKFRSSLVVYRLATNYSIHHPARQGSSEKRRVVRTADQSVAVYRPLLREVNEREIRHRPNPEPPPLPDPPPGRAAHSLHETRERDPAAEDKVSIKRSEGGLVAKEARSGFLHRQLLLLRSVRGVVGRHEVEDTVAQGCLDAAAVAVGPQRRIDPIEPLQCRDEFVGQREMVGRSVRGHVGPVFEETDEGR